MNVRRRSRQVRLLLPAALLLIWACAGCGGLGDAVYRQQEAAGGTVTLAGVDEGPGGLRLTSRQAPAGQTMQANAWMSVEARSFVSLADAATGWKQKDPPQVVVIGEAWARNHGVPAAWLEEFRRIGIYQGSKPVVAVVEGTAEAFVRRPDAGLVSRIVLERQAGVRDSLREVRAEYESDLALPFLALAYSGTPLSAEGNRMDSESLVSWRTMLFKNQQLAATLPPQQSRLLACLRGGSQLPDPLGAEEAQAALEPTAGSGSSILQSVSCRTSVAANGDLQQPRLRIALHVDGLAAPDSAAGAKAAPAYEREVYMRTQALIERLQRLETDPLNWGEAVRSQYPGFWTSDRWRSSFAKANIQLEVDVHIRGGVKP